MIFFIYIQDGREVFTLRSSIDDFWYGFQSEQEDSQRTETVSEQSPSVCYCLPKWSQVGELHASLVAILTIIINNHCCSLAIWKLVLTGPDNTPYEKGTSKSIWKCGIDKHDCTATCRCLPIVCQISWAVSFQATRDSLSNACKTILHNNCSDWMFAFCVSSIDLSL
jgi:hypothetical protein